MSRYIKYLGLVSLILLFMVSSADAVDNLSVSNITSARATISWNTDELSTGKVIFSKSSDFLEAKTAYDKRGEDFSGKNHWVDIINLAENTTYYYKVVSGNDEDGQVYTFTTFSPYMGLPFSIIGNGYSSGSIVFLSVIQNGSETAPLSTITGQNGNWNINLMILRDKTSREGLSAMQGDSINIVVQSQSGLNKIQEFVLEGNSPFLCLYE